MNRTMFLTILTMLLAVSAYAGEKPVAVHTFICKGVDQGPCPKGGVPSWIIQASDGNFYGVAEVTTEVYPPGGGLVFSLTPTGHFAVLYKFKPGKNSVTGSDPALIAEGPDGMLYGATGIGGASNEGTLFRLRKDGTGFQVIHSFCSDNCSNGYDPEGLVAGNDGNVYGTTLYGGGGQQCGAECGTIFQINAATGAYKVVQVLGYHTGSMAVGPDGTFYGITNDTVLFHYNEANNTLQQTQLQFPPKLQVGLAILPTLGGNGNLYGIYESFQQGGGGPGLFEVQLDGSNLQAFATIPNFPTDVPISPLVLGSDGNFWMTMYARALDGILNISSTDGSVIQTLKPFSQKAAVGDCPVDLMSAKDGKLWGLTQCDGKAPKGFYGQGVVFSLALSSE